MEHTTNTSAQSNEDKFDIVKKQTLLINLNEIFNGKRCFRIPDFQRGYSWTKAEREDLWNDIMNLPYEQENSKKLPLHYTGMLTLNEPKLLKKDIEYSSEGVSSNSFEMYYIIDGQQRLTSLIILLNEIIKYANESNIVLNQKLTNDELYNKYVAQNEFLYLNYSKKRENQDEIDCLKSILINDENEYNYSDSYYNINLKYAQDDFKSFLDKLKEEYSTNESAYFDNALRKIFSKIVNQLVFNIYYVSDNFDICTTFETMNNRGKQLSTLELLKNRLLYLTTLLECDPTINDQTIISLRENINKSWGEVYKNLGSHNNALDDDEFLKAHWIFYFGLTKQKGDDFIFDLLDKRFAINNQNITVEDINNYCNSLKKCSKEWVYINFPTNSNNFHNELLPYITKLSHLGVPLYVKSYLLAIVSFCKESDAEKINEHLKNLERFIFIRKFIGNKKTDYGWLSTFAQTIKQNRDNIETLFTEVNYTIENNQDYGLKTINENDRSDFVKDIQTKFEKGRGFYDWNGIYYFLYEYNLHLANKSSREEKTKELQWDLFTDSSNSKRKKLTIEHILPQTPTDYWKECFKNHIKEINSYTNALGNLLPLSRSINSKMQNYCYEIKSKGCEGLDRTAYKEGSLSEIQVSTKYKLWTAKNIQERSKKLIDFLNDHWTLKLTNDDKKALIYVNPQDEVIDEEKLKSLYETEKNKLKENNSDNSNKKITRGKRVIWEEKEYWNLYKDNKIIDFAKDFRSKVKEYLEQENLPNEEYFKRDYIGFKIKDITNSLFLEIQIQSDKLRVSSKIPNFNHKLVHKIAKDRTGWSLKHQAYISNFDNFNDVCKIIKSSYNQVKENRKK